MLKSVVHIVESIQPRADSAYAVVSGLFDVQEQRGWKVQVIDLDSIAEFESLIAYVDLIHIHGLWNDAAKALAPALKKCGKPYIISTYAMRMPGSVYHNWRRWAADISYQDGMMKRAWCLHTLTQGETDFMKSKGYCRRAKAITLGVSPPKEVSSEPMPLLSELANSRIGLYFGPIVWNPGLDAMVRAFEQVARRVDNAHLMMLGGGQASDISKLQAAISKRSLSSRVSIVQNPTPADTHATLQAADFVVYPIHRACSPTGPLLGLAYAKPVILTAACQMQDVQLAGAGWVVDDKQAQLVKAMQEAFVLDEQDIKTMGERATKILNTRYHWERQAPEYLNLYARVVARG